MQNYLVFIPLVLVLFVLYDAYVTVLSHRGAGPLTQWWTERFWRIVLWSKYTLKLDFPIERAGPFILGLIIAVWYLLLYFSWFAMFWLGAESLTNSKDALIDPLDVMYYIGTTFSTLGTGDYVPNGFPWTLLSSFGALIMTLLTTASISYILPIVNAVVARRVLIVAIHSLGSTTEEIIQSGWGPVAPGSMDEKVMGVVDGLLSESFKTQVYPVLSYFYFKGSHGSLNAAVLKLFDAVAFMQLKPDRKENMSVHKLDYVYRCLGNYVDSTDESTSLGAKTEQVSHIDFLELFGGELECVQKDLDEMLELRKKLLLLARWEGRCPRNDAGQLEKACLR